MNDSPIRDQREMVNVQGQARHETVEDVEAAWEEWASVHGFAIRRRHGDYSTSLRESRKALRAYISGGKWVADCPRCNGGIAAWGENPRGACLDCGTIYRIDHPDAAEAAAAIELLMVRPDPVTRSWHRHLDETVDDLARENEEYADRIEAARSTGLVDMADVVRVLGDQAAAKLEAAL